MALFCIIWINLQKHLNDKRFQIRYLHFIFSLNISTFYHRDDHINVLSSNDTTTKASEIFEKVWNNFEFHMKSRYRLGFLINQLINWNCWASNLKLSIKEWATEISSQTSQVSSKSQFKMKFLIVSVFFMIACAAAFPTISEHYALIANIGSSMKHNQNYDKVHGITTTVSPKNQPRLVPTAIPRAKSPSTQARNSFIYGTGALITKWAKKLWATWLAINFGS